MQDNMTIGVITQLTETGVQQTVDFMGHATTRVADVAAFQMDEAVREKLVALGWKPPQGACAWTVDEGEYFWEAACGETWCFINGGPEDNNCRFCHGCGKPVELIRPAAEVDDGFAT